MVLASRSWLPVIFCRHHAAFAEGQVPWVGHPCQKQPSTNTATRARLKQISGLHLVAGMRRSTRNCRPRRWTAERTANSHGVSRRGVRFIRPVTPGEDAATPLLGPLERGVIPVPVRGDHLADELLPGKATLGGGPPDSGRSRPHVEEDHRRGRFGVEPDEETLEPIHVVARLDPLVPLTEELHRRRERRDAERALPVRETLPSSQLSKGRNNTPTRAAAGRARHLQALVAQCPLTVPRRRRAARATSPGNGRRWTRGR